MSYDMNPIVVQAGVAPSTDSTPQNTNQYVYADKVRFRNGTPEKIGGWETLELVNGLVLRGLPRSLYSYNLDGRIYYLMGTHTSLYSIQGVDEFNATPCVPSGSATTITNKLSTYYATLGSNPYSVTSGSTTVTVTDTGHPFKEGDILSFSGATAFAGLSSGDLNGAKSIANVTTNTYQFNATTEATSTTSGGGASVVRSSRYVAVEWTNTLNNGDNVCIDSVASAVGGIGATDIEGVRVVYNATASGFDIIADAFATSSATSGGGDVVIREQIEDGNQDVTSGYGYGLGQYGVGQYGVGKNASTVTLPSIWSFDRFGSLVVMTRGGQTGLYSWNSSTNTLPELVMNAPTAIEYVFVTNNIVVTLGEGGTPNRVKWSDLGALTTWTATAENRAGEDDIEGAGTFISQARVRDLDLLFTNDAVYTMRYVDKPQVFRIEQLDPSAGLIGRQARVSVNGMCYWMGDKNFHVSDGATVQTLPCSMRDYVYDDLDPVNAVKSFSWYNEGFNEIWFHYPSSGQLECDRVMRYNILERTFVMDTFSRSCAEYPNVIGQYPRLADQNRVIYRHEYGYDADGVSMPWELHTPFFGSGADTIILGGVYPDNELTAGTLSLTVKTKRYQNQTAGESAFTLQNSDGNLIYRLSARYWQYVLSGNTLGQFWRAGQWLELVKKGGRR